MAIKVGKKYKIHHSRKGGFIGRIDSVNGEMVYIEIVEGEAKYLTVPNAIKGDVICMRKDFCSFTPI